MFYFIKESKHSVSQLAVVRSITNMLIGYVNAKLMKEDLFGSWDTVKNCSLRGLISMLSIGLLMQGAKMLPLTVYPVISRLNVFFVYLISIFYADKPFEWRVVLLIFISNFGVSLII